MMKARAKTVVDNLLEVDDLDNPEQFLRHYKLPEVPLNPREDQVAQALKIRGFNNQIEGSLDWTNGDGWKIQQYYYPLDDDQLPDKFRLTRVRPGGPTINDPELSYTGTLQHVLRIFDQRKI